MLDQKGLHPRSKGERADHVQRDEHRGGSIVARDGLEPRIDLHLEVEDHEVEIVPNPLQPTNERTAPSNQTGLLG